jgi:cell division protease FtsH
MSDKLGLRTFGDKQELVFLGREISEQKDYGEKIANLIDEEVSKIIQQAYEKAVKALTENKPRLVQIAQRLITEETLEGRELEALLSDSVDSSLPGATVTPAPAPVEATTTTKRAPKPKKAPTIPHPLPEQAPAPSE